MFQTNIVEKIKTHILCSQAVFFWKSCILWDNVEKYCRAGLATDEKYIMTHAHCVLATKVYNNTLRICNTHCFSMVTTVAQTHIHVMLCVHCLSCCSPISLFVSRDGSAAIATRCGLDGPDRFSAPGQNAAGTYPTFCIMSIGSLSWA